MAYIKKFFIIERMTTKMRKLKTNRGLFAYFILSAVTCGIYGIIFMHSLAEDTNEACKGDGQKTAGVLAFILLTIVTCGIYAIVWWYKLADRLNANCIKNNVPSSITGGSLLCWTIFGSMLCGIGPLVALHKLFKTSNALMANYNAKQEAAAAAAAAGTEA